MAYQDLQRLEAASSDFRAFCMACEQMEERWGQNHAWRVVDDDLIHFRHKHMDEVSRRIIPANFRRMSLVPMATTGDGNCLFNSASLLVCQAETLALELRLRTCLELAKNRQFYQNHPVLVNARIPYRGKHGPCVMSMETLCDLTCFSSSSSKVYGDNGFEAAFDNEIMKTCRNYSFSSTLQIMGLASVIGVPIEMVYPDQKNELLLVYRNIFKPRQCLNQSNLASVRITWTNSLAWPDRSKEFVVNHFVPLFNKSHKLSEGHVEAANTKEESSQENENPWFFVTNKRKSSAKRSRLTAMHMDVKSSKNHQDLSGRWQKQKEAGSTSQKFESGKKEGQTCNRQKLEKKVEADKKGCSDIRKNTNVEDLKVRNGKQGKVHEMPDVKKKCSEDTAKPHLIYENKNEGGKNTEEKKDVSQNIDRKKQSDILQEKEQEYEKCGPSKDEKKQEVRSKTEKSENNVPVTKNERKEVESPKNDSKEETKSDTIKRKNTTAEDDDILPPTKTQRSCGHQIPYTPSDFAIKFFEDRSALPFPGASRHFYQKQNVRANANVKRTKQRTQLPVI